MDERMSGLEFAAWRHLLGLTFEETAHILNVGLRTVKRWESGTTPIPYGVIGQIADLFSEHSQLTLKFADTEEIIVMSKDKDSYGLDDRPRSWYVAALARALQIEPDLMAEWE